MSVESPDQPCGGSLANESKDIFISYSRRDKNWVNEYLIRQFTAAELTFVIDDRDFLIGDSLESSMRKAVEACRYTLLIMTPDWVQSKWTQYESLLATDMDPEAEQRRVLAIKLKSCEVPPNVAPRLYLDLRNIEQRDQEMAKLLRQLGVSDDGIVKAQTSVAKKTLQLLIELMDEPGVRNEILSLRQTFEQIQDRNKSVSCNKTLHDCLQDIQLTIAQVSRDTRLLASGEDRWQELRRSAAALRRHLQKLLAYTANIPLAPLDLAFVVPFSRLAEDVHEALQSRDAQRFAFVVEMISSEVNRSLPLINDRILQKLRERPLQELIDSLESVYERVALFDFDEAAAKLLEQFRAGIETLEALDRSIRKLVADHASLQQVEVSLHLTSGGGEPTLYRISTSWRYVEPLIRELKLVERYGELCELCDQLAQRLNDGSTIRDDRFEENVKWTFAEFVEATANAFNRLDIDLLGICEQLNGHSAELQEVIGRMQSHDADP